MPEVNPQLPQTPNNEWKDLQFRFDGRWIPDVDGSLIGPNNYQTLRNMRYKDSGLEGVNGYSKINTTSLDGNGTLGDYPDIRNGHQLRSTETQKTYTLVHALADGGTQGRIFVNRTAIGSQGDFDTSEDFWLDVDDVVGGGANTEYPYFQDVEAGLTGRFSEAPQGNLAYANGRETLLFGGDESKIAAAFRLDTSLNNPVDITDDLNSANTDEFLQYTSGTTEDWVILTTRPIQGAKYYLVSGQENAATDVTATVKSWNGSSFSAVTDLVDGTASGGATLAQTGTFRWRHTKATAVKYHYQELYLYAYLFEFNEAAGTDGAAQIYKITVDTAFQDIVDVWDGVYRQPVQVQLDATNTGTYSDYSAQVNVASDEDNPVGMNLHGMTSSGDLVVMFTEKMTAMRFQMLGKFVEQNTNTPAVTVKYWDGNSYEDTTESDGTSCFEKSGLMAWTPPSDEQPRTLFNTFGYAYEITVSATLDGVTDGTNKRVQVDILSGIPAAKDLPDYTFTTTYNTRLMLGGPTQIGEGNRMDFTAANAPDVHNGADSSNDGLQSLYFGGVGDLTAAAPLYNRFGSNLLSVLLVLKDAETYLLVGDTPDEFVIYEVSKTIGCPAPLTLATGEVNMSRKPTEGVTRNIAMWLSASGPVMFDGASISAVRGMELFFDPNNDEYINWSLMSRARGWIDNVYKEYNVLIPSGSTSTENDKWLCYDLLRKKWYEKYTGTAAMPQAAWEVIDENGQRRNYGGVDTGYMMYLENGTSWDGTGINQRIKVGDFFPSSNIWDLTTIRKFKLLTHKFEDVSAENNLNIYYYGDTDELIGSGIAFVDSTDGLTGVNIDFEDTDHVEWAATSSVAINVNQDIGAKRIINIVTDENRVGWAHSFEFDITTTNVPRGFRPVAWGVRYRVERKDDQAT